MDQAENSRILRENKQIDLENRFGHFVDKSPCFPSDEQKVTLHDGIE